MKYYLNETNTVKRLTQLYEFNVFSEEFYKDILFTFEFLSNLQLKNQLDSLFSKTSPNNFIDLTNLSSIEVSILKSIFSKISVFQSKLKFDFGITE